MRAVCLSQGRYEAAKSQAGVRVKEGEEAKLGKCTAEYNLHSTIGNPRCFLSMVIRLYQ